MSNYKFSGHETFQCRHFWLKKGYDFVQNDGVFKSNEALIDLGVGKNMITSISHWLKAFKVTDNDSGEILEFGEYIFGEEGKDPYLEDIGTQYLLHYNIVSNFNQASIYRLTFEDFRKTRIASEFTSEQLFDFISKKLKIEGVAFSEKSLRNDVKVFLRMYQTSTKRGSKSIEDDFSSALIGLDMIDPLQDVYIEGEQVYRINYSDQKELDDFIFLYAILDQIEQNETWSFESLSFEDVQKYVSEKLQCNQEGTENKLTALAESGVIVYKQDAGRKEVQFKKKMNKWKILDKYYGRV
ncbi:MAG: DUF4007 family protein [Flavobacteriaceae bacterium]|nr:DUF4007 family protein [Flavobacteriaceae bacterium]